MTANLSKYLELQSASLRLESESIRQIFQNTTNKGSGFEFILRDRISNFLPPHWRVTHGEIIDSYGTKTGQIDIAVVNSLHPRGAGRACPEIVMFDATVAVGEAKLLLTTNECDSARMIAENICQCKLHPDNNNLLSDNICRKLPLPPFFLIALQSKVAFPTLQDKLCNELFHSVIVFDNGHNSAVVAVSDSSVSGEAIDFLTRIGTLVNGTQRVFLVDNPLLVLSWMLARYSVPMIDLTPIIPMYY